MKPGTFGLLSLLGVLLLSGCGEVSVNTRVRSDGSFRRTDVFKHYDADSADLSQIREGFILPAGTSWRTTKRLDTGKVLRYTAVRDLRGPEGLLDDICVRRANKGPILLSNAVSVRRIGPRRWRYVEILRWHGKLPQSLTVTSPKFVAAVRESLPESVSADAADGTAQALSARLVRNTWNVAFGPFPVDPVDREKFEGDAGQRLLTRRLLAGPVDRSVRQVLGSGVPDADCRATAKRLLTVLVDDDDAAEGVYIDLDDANCSGIPTLRFTLQAPGRLVESNGIVNKRRPNEVTWICHPEAAALGDVELTATWETADQTARR